MSFDISNLSKKKAKNQKNIGNNNISNGGNHNEITSASVVNNKTQTNRAGIRVYKIVILGVRVTLI
jgi:hypothetical protein